ncbi:MAG: hypothetical protein P8168_09670 [Deltaproteobacteria bacterium]
MKKLMIALICGLLLAPGAVWAQKWIPPHMDKDGSYAEGHWQTSEDLRQDKYSSPGKVNPYTGQFNSYKPEVKGPQPYSPTPMPSNPRAPNPYYPQHDYRYRGD